MTPLRKRTIDYMTIRGYASSTQKAYLYHLQEFAKFHNSCPSKLGEAEVIGYLRHLVIDKGLSKSVLNAAYSGIKILFVNILDKPWNSLHLPRPKKEKTLPVILSKEQVYRLFEVTQNTKHRTILMLLYGSGLHLEEVVRVRVRDINFSRKMIFVHKGKGKKDRYSILSDKLVLQLNEYLKLYRPSKWLFEGQNPTKPYGRRSVQSIYKKAKKMAGIQQLGGVHQMRHCFATHMVEAGMNIITLQKLLGHTPLRTTAIYLHLSQEDFSDFNHPLDQF